MINQLLRAWSAADAMLTEEMCAALYFHSVLVPWALVVRPLKIIIFFHYLIISNCRLVECDRESASNTAIAGYSLTGSVASSYLGQHRYTQLKSDRLSG